MNRSLKYKNTIWISDEIYSNVKDHGIDNEYILKFTSQIIEEILSRENKRISLKESIYTYIIWKYILF